MLVVPSSEDGHGYTGDVCADCWTGRSICVRSCRTEQVPRRRREFSCRELLVGTRAIEATKDLKNELQEVVEASVVSGGALGTEGLEEDCQNLFRHREDGTVDVRKWITQVPNDACKAGESVEGNMLEDDEARTVLIKSIMWTSTTFRKHVVGETEGSGAIPVVGVHSSWRRTKEQWPEWMVVWILRATVRLDDAESSAHLADWRHSNQMEMVTACNVISALSLIANLMKVNKLALLVIGPPESNESVVHFGWTMEELQSAMGELAKFKEEHKRVPPKLKKGNLRKCRRG